MQGQDAQRIRAFIEDHKPHVIVLGASCPEASSWAAGSAWAERSRRAAGQAGSCMTLRRRVALQSIKSTVWVVQLTCPWGAGRLLRALCRCASWRWI